VPCAPTPAVTATDTAVIASFANSGMPLNRTISAPMMLPEPAGLVRQARVVLAVDHERGRPPVCAASQSRDPPLACAR
jgi:hypothetical protein